MSKTNEWQAKVDALVKKAQAEQNRYKPDKAMEYYQQAINLIPQPREGEVAAMIIFFAMGEIQFLEGNYDDSLEHFSAAVRCKGGLGHGTIHLRLGELRYERGEMDRARDELVRAHMGGGEIIFEGEDPKYFELIKDAVAKKKT